LQIADQNHGRVARLVRPKNDRGRAGGTVLVFRVGAKPADFVVAPDRVQGIFGGEERALVGARTNRRGTRHSAFKARQ